MNGLLADAGLRSAGLAARLLGGRSNLSAFNKEAQASRRSQPPQPLSLIRSMQPAIMLLASQIMP